MRFQKQMNNFKCKTLNAFQKQMQNFKCISKDVSNA